MSDRTIMLVPLACVALLGLLTLVLWLLGVPLSSAGRPCRDYGDTDRDSVPARCFRDFDPEHR